MHQQGPLKILRHLLLQSSSLKEILQAKLLEPITKEAHVDLSFNFKDYYFSWWIDSTNIKPHRPANKSFFLDILYKDKDFHKAYLKELNKL